MTLISVWLNELPEDAYLQSKHVNLAEMLEKKLYSCAN